LEQRKSNQSVIVKNNFAERKFLHRTNIFCAGQAFSHTAGCAPQRFSPIIELESRALLHIGRPKQKHKVPEWLE
jgi:hypothetical protein